MNKKAYLVISAILTIIISVVMFGLWNRMDFTFWVIYLFAVAATWIVGINAAYRKEDNRSFAANLTTVTISVIYLILNVIWSMLSVVVLAVSGTVCLVGHIALLGTFLIVWILTKMAVKYINSQDN